MTDFLSQHDVVFETQPRIWQDGLPLGNGSLGSLAYAPFHPEWVVNKNDVWDYRHPEFKRFSPQEVERIAKEKKPFIETFSKENGRDLEDYPCPKSCGLLRIRFGHPSIYAPAHRISMRLRLADATLATSLDKHLSHPRITSFIHAQENILCIRVKDVSHMVAFHNNVDLVGFRDSLLPDATPGARGDTIWIDRTLPEGLRYVMMARIVPKKGTAYREMFRKTVRKIWWRAAEPSKRIKAHIEGEYAVAPVAGDFDLFLTVVTSREAKDPLRKAREVLTSAVKRGYDRLYQSHQRWWEKFWSASSVQLEDSFLEQLWYVSLYNLASAVRGTPAAALCGLWYGPLDTPSQVLPWHGYYTNDYNTQLAVMPVFRLNHPELSDGYFRTLLNQLPQARKNARELYRMPGAYYPLSTDPTGAEVTNGPYRFCHSSGPYWGVFLWWRYLYTRDRKFLEEIAYPILKEVSTFFASYMRFDENEGLYHLELTQPPELMSLQYSDPPFTIAPLKVTLKAAIASAKMLKRDASLVAKWQHLLDHFPPYPEEKGYLLDGQGIPWNHWPGCGWNFPLFPCAEYDPEKDPALRKKLIRCYQRSDRFWGTYGAAKGRNLGTTGRFHHMGTTAIWLGLRKEAKEALEHCLKANLKPSGLISHNCSIWANSEQSEENLKKIPKIWALFEDISEPPQPIPASERMTGRLQEECTEAYDHRETMFPALEGPAQYLLALGEMMLQSQNGLLRLFPCMPGKMDARFDDFRIEGAMLVSSAIKKGKVSFVKIRSLKGGSVTIRNPWKGRTVLLRSSKSRSTKRLRPGKFVEEQLKPGEVVTWAPDEKGFRESAKKPFRRREAGPKMRVFWDGTVSWIGKPEPAEYYARMRIRRTARRF